MKKCQWLFPGMLLLVITMFSLNARAQYGCGQQPIEEPGNCAPCSGDYWPDVTCGPGGDPLNFCYQGYGTCCNIAFTTANTIIDYFDCEPTKRSYFALATPHAGHRYHPRVFIAASCNGGALRARDALIISSPQVAVMIRERLRWEGGK